MSFDRNKSFEVENGIVTEDGGSGLFWTSASVPPISGNEVDGDRITDGNGRRWRFSLGAWVLDTSLAKKTVAINDVVEIQSTEQNLVYGIFKNFGQLKNFGELLLRKDPEEVVIPPFPDLPPDNFSYAKIASGESKTVPQNQQMNVFGMVQNLGQLTVLGELNLTKVFQEDPDQSVVLPDDNYSYKEIVAGETKTIPTRQQMVVVGSFKNNGALVVRGSFALISGEVAPEPDVLPPWKIVAGEVYSVKSNRVLQVPRSFVNLGTLVNNGFVYIGGQ